MPNSDLDAGLGEHFNMLRDLRKNAGVSQRQAAEFFELSTNGRRAIGDWELGYNRPRRDRRDRFITYLTELLRLREPEIRMLWAEVEEKWGWPPLTDDEQRSCGFAPIRPRRVALDQLNNDKLLARVWSDDPGIAAEGVRVACRRVVAGTLSPATLTQYHRHGYWLVRRRAIGGIVAADPSDALQLLSSFRRVSYHASQTEIRDYIARRFDEGRLNGDERTLALSLLDDLSHSEKASPVTKQKNAALIARLIEE